MIGHRVYVYTVTQCAGYASVNTYWAALGWVVCITHRHGQYVCNWASPSHTRQKSASTCAGVPPEAAPLEEKISSGMLCIVLSQWLTLHVNTNRPCTNSAGRYISCTCVTSQVVVMVQERVSLLPHWCPPSRDQNLQYCDIVSSPVYRGVLITVCIYGAGFPYAVYHTVSPLIYSSVVLCVVMVQLLPCKS